MTTKPRLLLVDDDAGAIHLLNRMLGSDYELRYALTGQAALDTARSWRPDLVLLDAQMPGMTGTAVCRELKADPTLAAIPVLFVTSLDATGAELMSVELGAVGVLSKPLDVGRVMAAVQAALQSATRADGLGLLSSPLPFADSVGGDAEDERARILIVDDDPSAVRMIHAALHEVDAQFHFATGGQQALDLARRHRPDLILLDMYMPGLDGLQTLRALKSDPTAADAQVIVVTRFGHPEMETRALDGGAIDFIAKPYTQAVLKARVGNVLRLREHARSQRQADREHWQRIGNARLARIVAAASDAILTADAKGSVVLINAAACRLFGVDAAQTIGQPLEGLLPGLALEGPTTLERRRMTLASGLGELVPVELSFSVFAEGADRLTTLVLNDRSNIERSEVEHRAKLQAEAALQAKTMMLSYVAHEIGNPLSSIIGLTQLLQNESQLSADFDKQHVLKLVADSGDHLRGLMRDVLDIHRLESGRFDLEPEDLSATDIAKRALDAIRNDAGAAQMRFTLRTPDGDQRLVADKTRLHQCLLNLLTNAVKYGKASGEVAICVRSDGEHIGLDVEDDGPGLSIDQQQHLFEPFNRLGRTGGAGAGVGLALTRMLTLAMQGSLSVRSAPGKGCCFTLRLPAAGGMVAR